MNARIEVVAGTARPNFLLLTPVCVLLGIASAATVPPAPAGYGWLLLAALGALLAHVSVNMLNEYEDFRSGLDFHTERTPFSGGSGALPRLPQGAELVRATGWAALLLTGLIGLLLVYHRGLALLPLGALGLLLIANYSTHIVRSPLASLVAPGLGFGPLMVLGTAFVVGGQYTPGALFASLVPLCLVSGLLLLNQFPDVEAARAVGRNNLPIAIGRRASSLVFAGLLAGAFGALALGIASDELPPAAALALLPGLGAPLLAHGVYRHAEDSRRLVPLLGWNVALTLGTPLLLGCGLLLG